MTNKSAGASMGASNSRADSDFKIREVKTKKITHEGNGQHLKANTRMRQTSSVMVMDSEDPDSVWDSETVTKQTHTMKLIRREFFFFWCCFLLSFFSFFSTKTKMKLLSNKGGTLFFFFFPFAQVCLFVEQKRKQKFIFLCASFVF